MYYTQALEKAVQVCWWQILDVVDLHEDYV